MSDHDAILRAAGITSLPPGANPNDIVEKILGYGLLQQRVIRRLLERDAIETLGTFRPIELEALRRYAGAEAAKPKWTVRWDVVTPDQDGGDIRIVAKSFLEGMVTPDETFVFQPRTIEEARRIRFRGEAVPGDVLYVWSQYKGVSLRAEAAIREQQIAAADAAGKKQSNIAAGQTIAITQGTKEYE